MGRTTVQVIDTPAHLMQRLTHCRLIFGPQERRRCVPSKAEHRQTKTDLQFAHLCLKPWIKPPKGRANWQLGALSKYSYRRSIVLHQVLYLECHCGKVHPSVPKWETLDDEPGPHAPPGQWLSLQVRWQSIVQRHSRRPEERHYDCQSRIQEENRRTVISRIVAVVTDNNSSSNMSSWRLSLFLV